MKKLKLWQSEREKVAAERGAKASLAS